MESGVPSVLGGVDTSSATASPIGLPDRIVVGELMSALTVSGRGLRPALDVFDHGAGLHVLWVDAQRVSAKVIEGEAIWDGTNQPFVNEPVGLVRPLLISDVPVPARVGRTGPDPARAGVFEDSRSDSKG